jgi:hypothetical protein
VSLLSPPPLPPSPQRRPGQPRSAPSRRVALPAALMALVAFWLSTALTTTHRGAVTVLGRPTRFRFPAQLGRASSPGHGPGRSPARLTARRDGGMSTAEYAVGTVAAVAFAGVLYAVVSSSATRDMITSVVQRALTLPF